MLLVLLWCGIELSGIVVDLFGGQV